MPFQLRQYSRMKKNNNLPNFSDSKHLFYYCTYRLFNILKKKSFHASQNNLSLSLYTHNSYTKHTYIYTSVFIIFQTFNISRL
jgi:hypothetical protein